MCLCVPSPSLGPETLGPETLGLVSTGLVFLSLQNTASVSGAFSPRPRSQEELMGSPEDGIDATSGRMATARGRQNSAACHRGEDGCWLCLCDTVTQNIHTTSLGCRTGQTGVLTGRGCVLSTPDDEDLTGLAVSCFLEENFPSVSPRRGEQMKLSKLTMLMLQPSSCQSFF